MTALHQIKNFGLKAIGTLGLSIMLAGCIETNTDSYGPKVDTNKLIVVGIMVPSGSSNVQTELLADSLVNAATLAMAEIDDVNIDLRLYPTGGDANQAASAAKRAANDGAKILIGPLFAQAANSAGAAVAGQNINLLSFSNNPDIAGGNIFILGDTFNNTANRVIGYATAQGKSSVAALVRADAAGTVAASAIEAAAKNNGAAYVGVAKYELTNESTVASVSATKSLIEQTGASVLVMDADAAGALPVFAQLLPEAGISSATTQFIGLARWDKTPERVRASTGLQGALFALNDTSATASFQERYLKAYGKNPHFLAGKAYDGMRAIITLLQTGSRDALTRKALTRSDGFNGANGVFRFLENGTNQRALAVATFHDGQMVVVDPAPKNFSGASF